MELFLGLIVVGAIILVIGKLADWAMGWSFALFLLLTLVASGLQMALQDAANHPPTPRPSLCPIVYSACDGRYP